MPADPSINHALGAAFTRPRVLALADLGRDVQRQRWIAALAHRCATPLEPRHAADRRMANSLSMPRAAVFDGDATRGRFFAVWRVDQSQSPVSRRRRGQLPLMRVTMPLPRYRSFEPRLLPARDRGHRRPTSKKVNAYDLGAGISVGPIQFKRAARRALSTSYGMLWKRDRALCRA
jgi:hypothetical protein